MCYTNHNLKDEATKYFNHQAKTGKIIFPGW